MCNRVIVFLFVCVLSYGAAYGQNLVTNPGFESKNNCPTGRSQILASLFYNDFPTAIDWISPLNTSPDYFHRCGTDPTVKVPYLSADGFHEPHGGSAYAGISMFAGRPEKDTSDYWSEYLETRLAAPLVAGHTYYVSYYVSLSYHSRHIYNIISVDNIGARLTSQKIDTSCAGPMFYINGPPDISTPPGQYITDTAGWTLVSGIYHAAGGEAWLTLGRFFTPVVNYQFLYSSVPNPSKLSDICYMLVDDVCVTDMDSPERTDTVIYSPQFPITMGAGEKEGKYQWFNGDTSQQIVVQSAGAYLRQRWADCTYYIDTFKVAEMPVESCVWLPNAFTPNDDGLNDLFGPGNTYCHPDFREFRFSIFNRWGQMVFETVNPGEKWDGTFNGTKQEMGVYYYILSYAYGGTFAGLGAPNGTPAVVRGDVTLIR